jgi:cystathionine beta-lyase
VISDEIHCDLTDPGCDYIPFASVSEVCRDNSITCVAPTKAFNLAGMQSSAVIIPNKVLRHKVWRGLNTDEVAEPNFFAVDAAIAAFTKGEDWLNELREYIFNNKNIVTEFVKNEVPSIKVVLSHATYLLWLDCQNVKGVDSGLAEFIRKETGLYITAGSHYGKSGSEFMRMNIACPQEVLRDGLARLKQGISAYEKREEKDA